MSTAIALVGTRRAMRVVERNARTYLRMWPAFLSGFLEPVFYLFSIGVGVGALVGQVPGPDGPVDYDQFVAPAMMASAAMNGCVFDTTFNFFFKYKYAKTYDGSWRRRSAWTDVVWGELTWALLRGVLQQGFPRHHVGDGLTPSAWSILGPAGRRLIASARRGGSRPHDLHALVVDFDTCRSHHPAVPVLGHVLPLSTVPDALAWVVRLSPLYQGVAIVRAVVWTDRRRSCSERRLPGDHGLGRSAGGRAPAGPDAAA